MADVDHFLKITGIPGESQDRTHNDEIEVMSWSWGLTRAGAAGPGGAAGRPAFQEISIQKRVDSSSPRLAQACAKGEHFPEAALATRRGSGPNFSIDFVVIKLSDVTISSYEASAGELAPIPTDAFSIDFTKIEYSYTLQKADGTADAPTRWSWDVKANKES